MNALQLAYTEYSLLIPLIAFALYLWKKRPLIKRPGRLTTSTLLALSLSFALSIWKPVTTPYGPLSFVDVGVMTLAMIFGPAIGGFAGSLGPAIGTLLTGGPVAVVMIARGLEGLITGYVSQNMDGSSGKIVGGALGGIVAISVVLSFMYLSGNVGRINEILSTMLTEVSTGIILGTGLNGIIKRKVPWTENVL